jgi:nicotinamidase-related amidase
MSYTQPNPTSAALICIDVQQDFTLPGAPAEVEGTHERLPEMRRLVRGFRAARRPIIQVVRLYLSDGSNVDVCRREAVEQGLRLALPGSSGAELVDELKPRRKVRLDPDLLLSGGFQPLGPDEWAMYKPRWDAFHGTALESHLHTLGVDTLVFCGCNFPNCPRTTIYGASMRDFRIVMAVDAVSGVYDRGLEELRNIGVTMMSTDECIQWIGGQTP